MLQLNTSLRSLDLSYCNLGNSVIEIIDSLKTNSSLNKLDLTFTVMQREAISEIANMLKVNTALTALNISCNYIDNDRCKEIAKALKVNTTLRKIDLSSTDIDIIGVTKLFKCLINNETLLCCHLDMFAKATDSLPDAVKYLEQNYTLTNLHNNCNDSINSIIERNKKNYNERLYRKTKVASLSD